MNPQELEQLARIALQHYMAGRADEAEKVCNVVLAAMPANYLALVVLGTIARETGRPDLANDSLTAALRLQPQSPQAHLNRGILFKDHYILRRDGDMQFFQEAERHFDNAIRFKPGWGLPHFHLAEMLLMAGKTGEAESSFRNALRLGPNLRADLISLGNRLGTDNRHIEALEAFRIADRIEPDLPDTRVRIVDTLLALSRIEDAKTEFGRISAEPDVGVGLPALRDSQTTLGRYLSVLKRLGRFEEAAVLYRRLIQASVGAQTDFNQILDLSFHHSPFPLQFILSAIKDGPLDRAKLREAWEALTQEPVQAAGALARFSRRVAAIELDAHGCALLALMWRRLYETGWYRIPEHGDIHPFKPAHFLQILRSVNQTHRALLAIGISLTNMETGLQFYDGGVQYNLSSSREWNAITFHHLVLPLLDSLSERDLYLALLINWATLFTFAQQPVEEAQAEYCDKLFRPKFQGFGVKLAELLPDTRTHKRPSTSVRPRVAFVVDMELNWASPIKLLCGFLKGCTQASENVVVPVVYSLLLSVPDVKKTIESLGVELVEINESQSPVSCGDFVADRFLALAQHIRGNRIDAIVFITLDSMLNLAGTFRILPVQLYWSMGHTYHEAPNTAAYIFNGSFERYNTLNGRVWRIGRAAIDDLYDPRLTQAASAFRKTNSTGEIVLGHLGRGQKIYNEEFLDALGKVLISRPQAEFWWTGMPGESRVDEILATQGAQLNSKNVGRVSGKMFVQAIDILLDPWPMGGGHSVYESMAAGIPVVFYRYDFMKEPGALRSVLVPYEGLGGTAEEQADVRRMFTGANGENLLLVAATPDEYVHMIQRLIDDVALRTEVGKAGSRFVQRYITDLGRMAQSYSAHIIEAIEEYWDNQEAVVPH
jgi:tetratricopeptide (TPR) repeat protein